MSYSNHDTDWDLSAKGNLWRRASGLALVVGLAKQKTHYWAMVDGVFLDGFFVSEQDAKRACEKYVEDQSNKGLV